MKGKKVRLKKEEAEALGFKVRENCPTERQRKANPKYYLNKENQKKLEEIRQRHKALSDECEKSGVPLEDVSHYWYKSEFFSIFSKKGTVTYEQVRDEIVEQMRAHAYDYKKIKRQYKENEHLLVVDPSDIHIGKLAKSFETGEEYNNTIAVERVKEGVLGILNKTSSFNIDKILFVAGNDILHTDNAKRTTTSGTPQDTDGQWYTNFLIAKDLYIEILELLISVADVHFVFCPSNHDYMSGFFLADTIASWFSKCENITFDVDMKHRKYYNYGGNLIGMTHGDGAKINDLPLLMANESKMWSNSKHRYIYTHHVHHKNAKDFPGVTIESMRSPSGADSWHSRNGYQHAVKAIEGFIHDKENGQIARITHIF